MFALFHRAVRLLRLRRTRRGREIDPSEILLDAENLPEFNTARFEGRLEQPITRRAFVFVGCGCAVIAMLLVGKIWQLQVMDGEAYLERSERNHLHYSVIFPRRGVIYDRNNVELAWNTSPSVGELASTTDATTTPTTFPAAENEFLVRQYTSLPGMSHLLGYVSMPKKDKQGFYYQTAIEGVSGVEKKFNNLLAGTQGLKIIETDVYGNRQTEGTRQEPVHGSNITLSIDSRIQSQLALFLKNLVDEATFAGGGGVIMDVETGEVLALTSYPEFDSNKLIQSDTAAIRGYENDPRKPYLNRTLGGVYTPGSIIKPFVAAGVLNENIIDPKTKILSTGILKVPNPYDPSKPSVFVDWQAHGWVDMRHAISVSSDIYFYEVGGGYGNQKGLGIANIEKYARMFGFGTTTGSGLLGEASGIIPSPEWKERVFGDMWRVGDTYNTAIGQYGFQVTVLQAVRATAAIANGGKLIAPLLEKGSVSSKGVTTLPFKEKDLTVVREGMLLSATEGTAKGLANSYVTIGAKTGTAQVGVNNERVNSWVIGFFPYEHPRYAFAIMLERGPLHNPRGGVYIMRQLFDWMHMNTPEYFRSE